jgi:hypothetical protein
MLNGCDKKINGGTGGEARRCIIPIATNEWKVCQANLVCYMAYII